MSVSAVAYDSYVAAVINSLEFGIYDAHICIFFSSNIFSVQIFN